MVTDDELKALADLLARLQSNFDEAYASAPAFGGPVADDDCTAISLGDLRLVIANLPAIIEQQEEIERLKAAYNDPYAAEDALPYGYDPTGEA